MIARAAERNPSVFLPAGPRCNMTEIIPQLLGIAEYIENPWGNTKFLLTQFKPSPPPISTMSKTQRKEAQEAVSRSKAIREVAEKLGVELGQGKIVINNIARRIQRRSGQREADVFEERREAEDAGRVLDEPATMENDGNGWMNDVGEADAVHS